MEKKTNIIDGKEYTYLRHDAFMSEAPWRGARIGLFTFRGHYLIMAENNPDGTIRANAKDITVEAGKTLGKVQLAKNVKGNFFRTAAR